MKKLVKDFNGVYVLKATDVTQLDTKGLLPDIGKDPELVNLWTILGTKTKQVGKILADASTFSEPVLENLDLQVDAMRDIITQAKRQLRMLKVQRNTTIRELKNVKVSKIRK